MPASPTSQRIKNEQRAYESSFQTVKHWLWTVYQGKKTHGCGPILRIPLAVQGGPSRSSSGQASAEHLAQIIPSEAQTGLPQPWSADHSHEVGLGLHSTWGPGYPSWACLPPLDLGSSLQAGARPPPPEARVSSLCLVLWGTDPLPPRLTARTQQPRAKGATPSPGQHGQAGRTSAFGAFSWNLEFESTALQAKKQFLVSGMREPSACLLGNPLFKQKSQVGLKWSHLAEERTLHRTLLAKRHHLASKWNFCPPAPTPLAAFCIFFLLE
ncbi:uncharacterized protein LOC144222659 [Crocuta crocuta]